MRTSSRVYIPLFSAAALFLMAVSGLHAQALVLKDGTRVDEGKFTAADGKITRTITLSNGQPAQASVAISDIERLDWPEVKQMVEADGLLKQGKNKEAIELLKQAQEYFRPFKGYPGSPYQEISFAYVAALDQIGDFDALLKALPEVKAMKWDEQKTLQLRITELNMARKTTSDQDSILSQAKTIMSETDDSAIRARICITIAEIHLKKERYEDALLAYLEVPVFYGSQVSLVPFAEMQAARCLSKMERFEDAVGFYQRIMETYPGSSTADVAKKEMLTINGLKNRPDTGAATAPAANSSTPPATAATPAAATSTTPPTTPETK